jgi:hypothetical protein
MDRARFSLQRWPRFLISFTIRVEGFIAVRSSNHSSPGDQLNHQHHQSNHKQNVDETAQRIRGNQPQHPQNEKNHKDCPKHRSPHFLFRIAQQALKQCIGAGLFAIAGVARKKAGQPRLAVAHPERNTTYIAI